MIDRFLDLRASLDVDGIAEFRAENPAGGPFSRERSALALQLAERFFTDRDFSTARRWALRALEDGPCNDAFALLGEVEMAEGNPCKAYDWYNAAGVDLADRRAGLACVVAGSDNFYLRATRPVHVTTRNRYHVAEGDLQQAVEKFLGTDADLLLYGAVDETVKRFYVYPDLHAVIWRSRLQPSVSILCYVLVPGHAVFGIEAMTLSRVGAARIQKYGDLRGAHCALYCPRGRFEHAET